MKKYQLSNTSTNFKNFLTEEFKGEKNCRFELSQDHRCIYVWLYCDQDLIDLGGKYMEYLNQVEA